MEVWAFHHTAFRAALLQFVGCCRVWEKGQHAVPNRCCLLVAALPGGGRGRKSIHLPHRHVCRNRKRSNLVRGCSIARNRAYHRINSIFLTKAHIIGMLSQL